MASVQGPGPHTRKYKLEWSFQNYVRCTFAFMYLLHLERCERVQVSKALCIFIQCDRQIQYTCGEILKEQLQSLLISQNKMKQLTMYIFLPNTTPTTCVSQ